MGPIVAAFSIIAAACGLGFGIELERGALYSTDGWWAIASASSALLAVVAHVVDAHGESPGRENDHTTES